MPSVKIEKKNDVVIIGGGIIGCTIAYRLAASNVKVTVVERGELCREASWAAAGMLAPNAEVAHSISSPMHELMLASHQLYPDFINTLEDKTGVDTGFNRSGSLMLALDFQESNLLAGLFEKVNQEKHAVRELNAKELRQKQPGLSDSVETGLFFPQDYHVNNRTLCQAVISAARNKGVRFRTGVSVSSLKILKNKVISARTSIGKIEGEIFILAAGAWSGELLKLAGIDLPIRPIRGQIVDLKTQTGLITHLLHSGSCYMVPRPHGRVLVGATMENAGFDKSVTADGVIHLLNAAIKILPQLKQAAIKNCWAGLRPDTSDNMPIIGNTKIDNLILATGHFRNGILLAPITAQIISDLIESKKPPIALEPFLAKRFLHQD